MSFGDGKVLVRLYIVAGTPNSAAAEANLRSALDAMDASPDAEIVDVMRDPDRAIADGILVTPTLVRVSGGASRRMIGRLEPPDVVKNFIEGN
jgi:circadian clock protein KaiB